MFNVLISHQNNTAIKSISFLNKLSKRIRNRIWGTFCAAETIAKT